MASSRSTPGLRKPTGAPRSTRYEVFGFGVANGAPAVLIDRIGPDNYWFRAQPLILLDRCGAGVDQMIAQLRAGVANYPYPTVPGPGPTAIPSCPHPRTGIHLPSNAVGKDFLPGGGLFAAARRGSGFQVSLYGLGDILLAVREGLEVNLPGLSLVSLRQAGIEGTGARQARDGGSMERQSPLFPVAEPGSSARSPSRWRTRRRHASRRIRVPHRERRSDAAGR
jgi:hypothetical protein